MGKTVVSTKADTLISIREQLKKSYIEDMVIFRVGDYRNEKMTIYHIIAETFKESRIVVRSSCDNEDGTVFSNAGHYTTIRDVESDSPDDVFHAIEAVIGSYYEDEETPGISDKIADEKILVQRQTVDVDIAGVIFTRDIIYNRPYYMISYDTDGETDSVTGGRSGKTKWIAKNFSREFLEPKLYRLIDAVREIESIFSDYEALDIEFAIDKKGRVIIYQVRQLFAVSGRPKAITDHEFMDTKAYAKCSYLDSNHILSDMAYWGIAENTGSNPRPLDCSLYREFITSGIWNEGIRGLGYKIVSEDLMHKVGNKPYISINYAMEGLTPSVIDDKLRYKLKNYYVDMLTENKALHDRIESEIIFNAYDFSTEERLRQLGDKFTENEIGMLRSSLYDITHGIISGYDKIFDGDRQDVERLIEIRHGIRANSPLTETNTMKLYSYIKELYSAIKDYGSPQFIRHSRCAFIAGSLCNSLVKMNYCSVAEIENYLCSISTLATEFERAVDSYSNGELSREKFNSQYGHLRLGTYDIRTDCYKKIYSEFENTHIATNRKQQHTNRPSADIVNKAIRDSGMKLTAEELFDFIEASTRNRELFKFEYFKTVSLMLDIIIRMGEMLGIAREDMSYLEIQDLMDYHSRDTYIQIIQERRNMYYANTYLVLPELILTVGDIDVIDMCEAKPAFITEKCVTAEVVLLDNSETKNITGKIVVLTKADPGYDWIFAKGIKGFVTKYGSPTCHMAIRCAELDIPAAIGCGENIFSRISMMTIVELDCATGRIIER